MRHLLFSLFIALGIVYTGCSSDKERILLFLSEINVELNDEVTILSSRDLGMTDYIFDTKFLVSNSDKYRLIEHIRNTENFNASKAITGEMITSKQWSMAYETDSTFELVINTPYKTTFKQHSISVFIESNVVDFEYWVE